MMTSISVSVMLSIALIEYSLILQVEAGTMWLLLSPQGV